MNEMYEYLEEHAYISKNKKSNYQFELSKARAECIANKYNSLCEEKDKEIERLNNIRNKAIEYVEESYNVTVEGIEGVAKFFSKRNEILSKILKGEDKE